VDLCECPKEQNHTIIIIIIIIIIIGTHVDVRCEPNHRYAEEGKKKKKKKVSVCSVGPDLLR